MSGFVVSAVLVFRLLISVWFKATLIIVFAIIYVVVVVVVAVIQVAVSMVTIVRVVFVVRVVCGKTVPVVMVFELVPIVVVHFFVIVWIRVEMSPRGPQITGTGSRHVGMNEIGQLRTGLTAKHILDIKAWRK